MEEHSYFNSGGHKGNLYYYTLGGRLLGALDNSGKTTFYLSDALGSVLSSFSNVATSAAIKGNQVFGPYGNARDSQGTINTAKGFTGQYNDSLTGLDYYGSRYYDQVAGVFLSADTVHGNGSGANPYAYVGGNPETFSDPTGQMFVPPGGGGSAGGVTGGGGSTTSNALVPLTPPNAVQPVGSALAPTAQNANSCGQVTQADCTPIKWNTLTNLSGTLRLRLPLGVGLGGIVCLGVGPCFSSPFASGPSIDITIQVSLTTGTPVEGCATLTSCVVENQGVDDKPTDDAAALGFGEGACSFTTRTVVATEHGKRPLGQVHAGERVWAYNPKTHKMELQPILHVWVHADHDLVDLTITTPTRSRFSRLTTEPAQTSEVIHTNQKHPFFTLEQGFLSVSQITLGMHLLRADGRFGVVIGWKMVPGTQVMYNLEVAQDHTFTVGDGQFVVHNCASGPTPGHLDVVPYDTDLPTGSGFEKHHGVLDVWAKNNISGYDQGDAPAVILTTAEHNATRAFFANWRIAKTGSLRGYINWGAMSPQEVQALAYGMFDAARVPSNVVQNYFRSFYQYLYGL